LEVAAKVINGFPARGDHRDGWWWADPIAGLCMPPIIIRQGIAGR